MIYSNGQLSRLRDITRRPRVFIHNLLRVTGSDFRLAISYRSPAVFGVRKLPELLKVVAGQTERGGVVQPAFFEGDVATVPSSAVSRWVENESFGLVSDFTPATFSRCRMTHPTVL